MINFKVGDIVKTRDGREVEILKVDAPYPYPLISMDVLTGCVIRRYADGRIFRDQDCDTDLIPPKRTREVTVWVNVYPRGFSEVFNRVVDAEFEASDDALAVAVPHTFTLEW